MKLSRPLTTGWLIQQRHGHGPLTAAEVQAISQHSTGEWLTADMPAQVHEVLLAHSRITDPAEYGQAAACLWVSETDWVYVVHFTPERAASQLFLHFHGLDTVVDLYLNGIHFGWHEDIYLPFRREITCLLCEENILLCHFHAPKAYAATLPYPAEWEGRVARNRLLRKPHEDFNDFNGVKPYLTPIGIFADVCLEYVDAGEISKLDCTAELAPAYDQGTVHLRVCGTGCAKGGILQGMVTDPDGESVESVSVPLTLGESGWQADCRIAVANPLLWWPRGYGAQPLYTVTVQLKTSAGVQDITTREIGFRDLRMRTLFDFTVNGVPVKLWGANFTPMQGISHCWDVARAEKTLNLVENAHMNTLRMWGPGAPYPESFFVEADRRGLLLWAEFFHTWGEYPDTPAYQELCRQEAVHYVRTLKHHPSILLWCGGNEHQMGAEMGHPGAPVLGSVLYDTVYREVCAQLDPQRYYHPNSPSGGAFANDPRVGDSHSYTHTWFVPGEAYPVLFTENTRMSTPLLKTLRRVIPPEIFWPEGFTGQVTCSTGSPIPDSWSYLTLGKNLVYPRLAYLELCYDIGGTPEGAIYRLGAGHSRYIRQYVERYRRGKPVQDAEGPRRCMGHYLWKLNSTWPMIYSDVIDYFLEPNMAYYALRRAYSPVLLSIEIADLIHLWLVNDTAEAIAGELYFHLVDMHTGERAYTQACHVEIPIGASVLSMTPDVPMFSRQLILLAELRDANGHLLARSSDFAAMERQLAFPEARLTLEATANGVTVGTDTFARCVELTGDADGNAFGWFFEDNFFDLLPGETHAVRILGCHDTGLVTAKSFYSPWGATKPVARQSTSSEV